jgi:hypothetical protein
MDRKSGKWGPGRTSLRPTSVSPHSRAAGVVGGVFLLNCKKCTGLESARYSCYLFNPVSPCFLNLIQVNYSSVLSISSFVLESFLFFMSRRGNKCGFYHEVLGVKDEN